MPLPFLTASRDASAPDRDAGPASFADEGREHWRRPYRPGPYRVGAAALFLLFASYLLLSALVIALAGSPTGAAVCAAVALAVIALAVRLVRVGVRVSAHGLRRTGLLGTTTVPWREVTEVRTVQQPVRWLGTPRTVQGQALVVGRVRGGPLTPVVTDRDADFLGRPEAFDRAADAVEGWAAEYCRRA